MLAPLRSTALLGVNTDLIYTKVRICHLFGARTQVTIIQEIALMSGEMLIISIDRRAGTSFALYINAYRSA